MIFSHLCSGSSCCLFVSVLSIKMSAIRRPAHACFVPCQFHTSYLITLITFGEEYKSWNSSLCASVTCVVCLHILASILYQTPSCTKFVRSSAVQGKLHSHPRKNQVNLCDYTAAELVVVRRCPDRISAGTAVMLSGISWIALVPPGMCRDTILIRPWPLQFNVY
jgi:hypothetical protein